MAQQESAYVRAMSGSKAYGWRATGAQSKDGMASMAPRLAAGYQALRVFILYTPSARLQFGFTCVALRVIDLASEK